MPSLPQRLSRSRYRLTSGFPLLPSHAWGIPPPTRADHPATRLVAYARPGTGLTMLINYVHALVEPRSSRAISRGRFYWQDTRIAVWCVTSLENPTGGPMS